MNSLWTLHDTEPRLQNKTIQSILWHDPGVRDLSCVSCVPASCFLIWFVSCHYWLIRVQVCVICECVFKSRLFSSMSSGLLVIPGVSTLPCLPLMLSLKTIILKYVLVCVFLVSPCCVHRDRRPDQNSKRRPFTSFCFVRFFKCVILFPCFVPRGKRVRSPRALMPAVRGSLCRRSRLSHPAVRGSAIPPFAGVLAAVRGSAIPPFAGVDAAVRGSAIPPFAGVHAAVRGSTSPQFTGDDATIHG